MSPDSMDQWREATELKFTNASPYLYALIMATLRIIHDSPSSMALFQILLITTAISLFINYCYKKGVNKFWLALIVVFYGASPQFGVYNVTIWKDVLYSDIVLFLSIVTFLFIVDKTKQTRLFLVLIALFSALAFLFRYNGIIFLFVPSLILFFTKRINLKTGLKLLSLTLMIYLFFGIFMANLLKVKPIYIAIEGITIKTVGSMYHMGNANLSDFERESFKKINSEADWANYYDCTSVNELFFDIARDKKIGIFSPAIDPNKSVVENWHKAFISALIKNPNSYIYDRACQTAYLLGVRPNTYRFTNDISKVPWNPIVIPESKFPAAKTFFNKYLNYSISGNLKAFVFWATWPALLFDLLAFIYALRKKALGTIIYISFIFVNTITAAVLVPAVDYRYVYFVYLCTPLIPALLLIEASVKGQCSRSHR